MKLKFVNGLPKKMKRFNTTTGIVDTGLITSTVITGNIRIRTKAKVKQIPKEQREELLEKGRKEGKEDFLRKIANTSGIQGVSAI